jgi:hypothetical protein
MGKGREKIVFIGPSKSRSVALRHPAIYNSVKVVRDALYQSEKTGQGRPLYFYGNGDQSLMVPCGMPQGVT